jgi:hypothetical protein
MDDQKNKTSGDLWSKIKTWVIGLTAVLVVLPSLINAGIDVYKSLLDVPKTQFERINAELFQKYFNKSPVVTVPVPVKTSLGTVKARLSVYEEGDIFAEYGDYSQWFPFPLRKTASSSLFSTAHAQTPPATGLTGEYRQVDKIKGNTIERSRYYSNGTKETYTININTGEIQNKVVTRDSAPPSGVSRYPAVKVQESPLIDLEAIKGKR